jgi:aubergine-like protein
VERKIFRECSRTDHPNEVRQFRNFSNAPPRYNNRTYRIDEIAWEMSPTSKFTKRNGQELSFAQYYMQNHNRSVTDNKQPLLVHKHRTRSEEIIFLIPELCTMTGVSESMRQDSKVMQDMAAYMRVNPEQRAQELSKFVTSVKESARVSKVEISVKFPS